MNIIIQRVNNKNLNDWKQLVKEFWKNISEYEINLIINAREHAEFIAIQDGEAVGFLNATIRHDYVEGCKDYNTAYIEGIYVKPDYRKNNIGSLLIKEFEKWAMELGITELASDAEIDNQASINFHNTNGYKTVSKNVHFAKILK